MYSVKKCAVILCIFILFVVSDFANAKSLYVMQNFRAWPQIYTYDINGINLERIDEGDFGTSLNYPISPAIYESAHGRWLFNTIEYENAIELIDIFKNQDNKIVKVENAMLTDWTDNNTGGMCGIVIDKDKRKLYFVQRYTNRLWSYSWNPRTESLTCDFDFPSYVELTGIQCGTRENRIGAYGVALSEQNDLLYVADNTPILKYYHTNNWSLAGQININCNAISVAIDDRRHKLYYASMKHVYGDGDPCLYQYNISTSVTNSVNVGSSPAGIAVDPNTGLVYITTSYQGLDASNYKLMIYDANLTLRNTPMPLGCPTGLVVGEKFKLRKLDIVKDDNDTGPVLPLISRIEHEFIGTPYNWLTYNIQWDANGFADSNVVVIDFLPFEVNGPNYISDGGQYIASQHIVRWELGNISANSSGTFQIQCGVNYYAKPCGAITNKVHIEGDNYYDTYIMQTDVNYYGGEILYVNKNVVGGYRNGTSWQDALPELSEAMDIANKNCASVVAIWAAKGIYKPIYDTYVQDFESKSFVLAPNVGLFGHFAGWEESLDDRDFSEPANETILDGQIGSCSQKVYYVLTAENISAPDYAAIDGFTIRNALQYGIYIDDSNVGILNCKIVNNPTGIYTTQWSHPDIHNCVFKNNAAEGLNVVGSSSPVVSYSVFDGNNINNTTGIKCNVCAAELQNSLFKNCALYGADASQSTLTITDCNFRANNCGFRLQSYSTAVVDDSFVSNSTGTGVSCSSSNLTMERSVISDNTNTGLDMSGYCNLTFNNNTVFGNGREGLLLSQNLTSAITNNLIYDNGANSQTRGAGLKLSEPVWSPLIRNNTICGNRTYGIELSYYGGEPAISNCVIYGNDTNDFYRNGKDFYNVTYSCLQNRRTGTGNFVADPCFVGTNDFHITKNSRCINAGNPNISYANEVDIDRQVRTQYGRADIGCDEFYGGFGDYNADDIVNFLDYRYLAENWQCNEPDYSIDDDNDVDIYDLTYFANEWLWQNEAQIMMLRSTQNLTQNTQSSSLLLTTVSESLSKQPTRLRQQSERFYSLSPRNTVSAYQKQLQRVKSERFSECLAVSDTKACRAGFSPRGGVIESEPVDVNGLLNWLDDLWQNDEAIRGSMSEDEYLEFRNSISSSKNK